jgi:hypothetical protein
MDNYEKKSQLILEHIESLPKSKQKEEIMNLLKSIKHNMDSDREFYSELETILDDKFPEYTISKSEVK